MKAVGIVRHADNKGRGVIPASIRRLHRWKRGQTVEIYTEDGVTVRSRQALLCVFCGHVTKGEFRGKRVCATCREALRCSG